MLKEHKNQLLNLTKRIVGEFQNILKIIRYLIIG